MNDLLAENLYFSLTLMYTFVIMSAITVSGAARKKELSSHSIVQLSSVSLCLFSPAHGPVGPRL